MDILRTAKDNADFFLARAAEYEEQAAYCKGEAKKRWLAKAAGARAKAATYTT